MAMTPFLQTLIDNRTNTYVPPNERPTPMNNAKRSPDYDAIMSLPAAKHPKLSQAVAALAASPKMDLQFASELIATAATDIGISLLDIEMADPRNNVRPAFGATTRSGAEDAFQAGVTAELIRMTKRIQGGN